MEDLVYLSQRSFHHKRYYYLANLVRHVLDQHKRPVRVLVIGKTPNMILESFLLERFAFQVALFSKYSPELRKVALRNGVDNVSFSTEDMYDIVFVKQPLQHHVKEAFQKSLKWVVIDEFYSAKPPSAWFKHKKRHEIPNIFHVYPTTMSQVDLGVFSVESKPRLASISNSNDTFAIITPTYQRPQNKTLEYLRTTYECVMAQEDKNWEWFIVGDEYGSGFEKDLEFLNDPRIHKMDLFCAGERHYMLKDWSNLGCYAYNTGVKWAKRRGLNLIVNLDDDDEWLPDHLACLRFGFDKGANFVCTLAQHIDLGILPRVSGLKVQPIVPGLGRMVNSCFAYDANVLDWIKDPSYASSLPCDGQQLNKFCRHLNLEAVCVPWLTVLHTREAQKDVEVRWVREWTGDSQPPKGWKKILEKHEKSWIRANNSDFRKFVS